MVEVSVLLPVLKYRDYVEEAIESILQQSFQDFEVVVIHSKKDSRRLPSKFREDPHIRYERQEGTGIGQARNQGIAAAEGDYIAFLDADDLSFPDRLDRQISILQRYSDVKLVYSPAIVFTGQEHVSVRGGLRTGKLEPPQAFHSIYTEVNFIPTSTVMAEKECLPRFAENLETCEDVELYHRLTEKYSVFELENPVGMKRSGEHYQLTDNLEQNMQDHISIRRGLLSDPKIKYTDYLKAISNIKSSYAHEYYYRGNLARSIVLLTQSILYWPTNNQNLGIPKKLLASRF